MASNDRSSSEPGSGGTMTNFLKQKQLEREEIQRKLNELNDQVNEAEKLAKEEQARAQFDANRRAKYKALKKECKLYEKDASDRYSELRDARIMRMKLDAVAAERTLCAKTALDLNKQMGRLDHHFGLFKSKWSAIRQGTCSAPTIPGARTPPESEMFHTRSAYELVRTLFLSLEEEDANVIPLQDDSLYFTGPISWYPSRVHKSSSTDDVVILSDDDDSSPEVSCNSNACAKTVPPASLKASTIGIGEEFLDDFTGCNCVNIGVGVCVISSKWDGFKDKVMGLLRAWKKLRFRKISTANGSTDLPMFLEFAKHVSEVLWPGPTFDVASSNKNTNLKRDFHTGRVRALNLFFRHCLNNEIPGGTNVGDDEFNSFMNGVKHQIWLHARRKRNIRIKADGWKTIKETIRFVDDEWICWFDQMKKKYFNNCMHSEWHEHLSGFNEVSPPARGTYM